MTKKDANTIPLGTSTTAWSSETREQFTRDFTDGALSMYDLQQRWRRPDGTSIPQGTLYRFGQELNLHRPTLKADNRTQYRDLIASVSRMVPAIPVLEIPKPNIDFTRDRLASLVVKISDLHFGRKTRTFNIDEARKRVYKLGCAVDSFINMISPQYRILEIHVFAEGDWVLGERLGYQVNVEEVEKFILDQLFEGVVPIMSQWLLDRLLVVPEIHFHGVAGNHGELGRFQSNSANWDTFAYKVIEQRLHEQERVKFNIATREFYTFAQVQDLTFLIVHGNQFKVSGQKAISEKVLRWNSTMPAHFDCVSFAHFHTSTKFQAGNIMCYGNGSILSDDEWVRETLALDGTCSQTMLLVSGKDVICESEVTLDG